jgi:hypothetical protein
VGRLGAPLLRGEEGWPVVVGFEIVVGAGLIAGLLVGLAVGLLAPLVACG